MDVLGIVVAYLAIGLVVSLLALLCYAWTNNGRPISGFQMMAVTFAVLAWPWVLAALVKRQLGRR